MLNILIYLSTWPKMHAFRAHTVLHQSTGYDITGHTQHKIWTPDQFCTLIILIKFYPNSHILKNVVKIRLSAALLWMESREKKEKYEAADGGKMETTVDCLFCSEVQFYITAISTLQLPQHINYSSSNTKTRSLQFIMALLTAVMWEIRWWNCLKCKTAKGNFRQANNLSDHEITDHSGKLIRFFLSLLNWVSNNSWTDVSLKKYIKIWKWIKGYQFVTLICAVLWKVCSKWFCNNS